MHTHSIIYLFLFLLFSCAFAIPCCAAFLADETPPVFLFYASGGYLEKEGNFISKNFQAILDGSNEDLPMLIAYGGTDEWEGIRYVTRFMLLDDSRNKIFGDDSMVLYLDETANMGNSETLSAFIRYAREMYPNHRLWLILIGHGDAYAGVLLDENYNDMLDSVELGDALLQSGTNIELIGFDACLMATLEMAVAVDGYAVWMIASQETEPGMGWDYETWLLSLASSEEIELPYAAFPLVQAHMNQSEPGKTLSVLNLDEAASVSHNVGELGRALTVLLQTSDGQKLIETALLNSQHFGLTDTMALVPITCDILSFTQAISDTIPYLSQLAKNAEITTDRMIVLSRHDAVVPNAHGISFISPLLMTPDLYSVYANHSDIHRDWNLFLSSYASQHPPLP